MKIISSYKQIITYIVSFLVMAFLFQACVEEKGACIGFNSDSNFTKCHDDFEKHDCAKLNEDQSSGYNWTFYPYETCDQHDVTVFQAHYMQPGPANGNS